MPAMSQIESVIHFRETRDHLLVFLIKKEYAGLVIGHRGQNLKEITTQTHTFINIRNYNSFQRLVYVDGNADNCLLACRSILEMVLGCEPPSPTITLNLVANDLFCERFIKKETHVLDFIMGTTNTHIFVTSKVKGLVHKSFNRLIIISSYDMDNVMQAAKIISKQLQTQLDRHLNAYFSDLETFFGLDPLALPSKNDEGSQLDDAASVSSASYEDDCNSHNEEAVVAVFSGGFLRDASTQTYPSYGIEFLSQNDSRHYQNVLTALNYVCVDHMNQYACYEGKYIGIPYGEQPESELSAEEESEATTLPKKEPSAEKESEATSVPKNESSVEEESEATSVPKNESSVEEEWDTTSLRTCYSATTQTYLYDHDDIVLRRVSMSSHSPVRRHINWQLQNPNFTRDIEAHVACTEESFKEILATVDPKLVRPFSDTFDIETNKYNELEQTFVHVPEEAVGAIIGIRGYFIRTLMKVANCAASVIKSLTPDDVNLTKGRKLKIVGTCEAQWKAQYLIYEKLIKEGFNLSGNNDQFTISMPIPRNFSGHIVGRGGRNIVEVEHTTGCNISLPANNAADADSTEIMCYIFGDFYDVIAAQRILRSQIYAQSAAQSAAQNALKEAEQEESNLKLNLDEAAAKPIKILKTKKIFNKRESCTDACACCACEICDEEEAYCICFNCQKLALEKQQEEKDIAIVDVCHCDACQEELKLFFASKAEMQ